MDEPRFLSATKAAAYFGVTTFTITSWRKQGFLKFIKPPRSNYRYDVSSFNRDNPSKPEIIIEEPKEVKRQKVFYCRVSSRKQTDDLARQAEFAANNYPDYKIIKDVGSGLNYKRKGLLTLFRGAIDGTISEVVVAHRDRLCRFGIELIEWFLEQYKVKLVILDKSYEEPEKEICNDILSVLHVFSCRINGKRRYGKKEKTVESIKSAETTNETALSASDKEED